MTTTNRLKRIAGRIAALEAKRLPPPKLDLCWIPPGPLAADEELFIVREEVWPHGSFRHFKKRPKQQKIECDSV